MKNVTKKLLLAWSFAARCALLSASLLFLESFTGIDAQDTISLTLDKVDLARVFKAIEEQGKYRFVYKEEILPKDKRVSLRVKNATLEEVLDIALENTLLTFRKINSNLVTIVPLASDREVSGPLAETVKGKVINEKGEPLAGATVVEKGAGNSAITKSDGSFTITVTNSTAVLLVTYVGYAPAELPLSGRQSPVSIQLLPVTVSINDVVIVGYGKQKRESVVAAVAQVNGAVLERAGGVSSVGAALTGNVPGLITAASTGLPGEEDPRIIIRGRSTWNNADPLILVDGVERPMTSIDIGSVESISVLKDASATAVFGVRGANGVILITTKRGRTGKASIRGTVNTIVKVPSRLPGKYDAYDALRIRNKAIEYELALKPESWNEYLPQAILDKYRYPASLEEAERYPNVDWAKALFKDYAMSHNANINISGGTRTVKYFTSADFLHEGDLFKVYDNNRGYKPGFGFKRLNVRSNLDFQLTPSTLFKTNLFGSYGVRKSPWGFSGSQYGPWIDAYTTAPDVFLPVYSDGSWGYYAPSEGRAENSARSLAIGGIQYQTTARITTDFTIDQDLDMLVRGLKFSGTVSLDNTFVESDRGINDLYNDTQRKWIDPGTGMVIYKQAYDGVTNFDFQEGIKWSPAAGAVTANQRRLFYQAQLNYAVTLGSKHNVTAMGLFNRNESASGSEIPNYREDWVFRTTYNYAGKYMVEYNGAYNGSEKFSPEHRFAFFSSGGVGWIVSKEKFMQGLSFLDLLKIRASYGQIGDDNISGRWLYMSQWAYGGRARLGVTGEGAEQSPYTWYTETAVGNPDIHWEKVEKANLGIDFGFLEGMITGKADFFRDNRSEILLAGGSRAIPSYYGTTAPVANLGRVQSKGYELELHFNYTFKNKIRLWADLNMTHSQNKIIDADNPTLLPEYQKTEGKEIGQTYSYVSQGYYNTWDELYGSTMHNTNDNQKLPGNYHIVDYNGDGVIDAQDNIPYGYSSWPQNTYNATIGIDWKGLGVFVQFYGVNNATRQVVFNSLSSQSHVVYDEGAYWTKDNTGDMVPMLRWLSTPAGYYRGTQYMYDGSYIRLKNAEIAYSFDGRFIKSLGLAGLRIYLNGNNLYTWTKMPDDRESNFAGTGWASQGAYPTVKRYNLGANITF
ncbi:SusC/RagA family TonB-linked outer membrane protein [Chitinophaga japonensis]|uniref:TonB-linked SusC/RagA family outer membrane protein n=1 Tax=Chitinophaga japonensis TaxID=104662 RepID=A0A562SUP4_CHIJA|nr:SusC/RagA family TonB-linked outer membrane protein [Chitinophaga japonensis]TWI84416.1 TonB-linked SusC/RagA family outer membrane protein [Chitinophaga japonensis]